MRLADIILESVRDDRRITALAMQQYIRLVKLLNDPYGKYRELVTITKQGVEIQLHNDLKIIMQERKKHHTSDGILRSYVGENHYLMILFIEFKYFEIFTKLFHYTGRISKSDNSQDYFKKVVDKMIMPVFVHEYIHYIDAIRSKQKNIVGYTKMPDDPTDIKGIKKYWSQPAEFNAYFHQIVSDILSNPQKLAVTKKVTPQQFMNSVMATRGLANFNKKYRKKFFKRMVRFKKEIDQRIHRQNLSEDEKSDKTSRAYALKVYEKLSDYLNHSGIEGKQSRAGKLANAASDKGNFFLKVSDFMPKEANLRDLWIVFAEQQHPTGAATFLKGGFGHNLLGYFIILYLLKGPGDKRYIDKRFSMVKKIFIHEFTHYLDEKRSNGKITKIKNPETNVSLSDYINNASEFNAFYMETTGDMEQFLRKAPEAFLGKIRGMRTQQFVHYVKAKWMPSITNYLQGKWLRKFNKRLARFHRQTVIPILKGDLDEQAGVGKVVPGINTTADIKPNQIKINLKKLRLAEAYGGHPIIPWWWGNEEPRDDFETHDRFIEKFGFSRKDAKNKATQVFKYIRKFYPEIKVWRFQRTYRSNHHDMDSFPLRLAAIIDNDPVVDFLFFIYKSNKKNNWALGINYGSMIAHIWERDDIEAFGKFNKLLKMLEGPIPIEYITFPELPSYDKQKAIQYLKKLLQKQQLVIAAEAIKIIRNTYGKNAKISDSDMRELVLSISQDLKNKYGLD